MTGAGGYLGSALCAALAPEHDVIGIHRVADASTPPPAIPGARMVAADVTDERSLAPLFAGARTVFHLAAITGEQKCLSDPVAAARANLLGTAAVVRAAQASKVDRVIFASSYWVYAVFAPHRMPLVEDDELGTDTLYGAMKAAGEQMVSALPDSVTLRFANVYGYGVGRGALWDGFVGRSVIAAFASRPITLYGTGEQGLELLHISDALRAFRLALEGSPPHAVYNIGSGAVSSVAEVARTIAELVGAKLGREVEIRREPAPHGKIWPDRWLDVTRARVDLGFTPLTSLRDGSAELVEAYAERS